MGSWAMTDDGVEGSTNEIGPEAAWPCFNQCSIVNSKVLDLIFCRS